MFGFMKSKIVITAIIGIVAAAICSVVFYNVGYSNGYKHGLNMSSYYNEIVDSVERDLFNGL